MVVLAGKVTTTAVVDHAAVIREAIIDIGNDDEALGFDGRRCAVLLALNDQSPDISRGVSEGCELDLEQGVGDQRMVFGFACRETLALMPLPIQLAHQLMIRQAALRQSGRPGWLRPDAKSQASLRCAETRPVAVGTVVLSMQHSPAVAYQTLCEFVIEEIVRPVLPDGLETAQTRILVNSTGRFGPGGPYADCGLTGRKIIVDTYGGARRHGGGALSGKDPSKIDRSGAYAARHVAKKIAAAGLADVCEVQIAYAIGIARPVTLRVDTFGTAVVCEARIEALVQELFDLRPKGIIQMLDLLRPIYRKTAISAARAFPSPGRRQTGPRCCGAKPRSSRSEPAPPGRHQLRRHRCSAAEAPHGPHALRVHLQDPDNGSRTPQTRPDPSVAGTKRLDGTKRG